MPDPEEIRTLHRSATCRWRRALWAYLRPLPFGALSLTATVFPAIVTVVLRADPVFAPAVTVTDPLPDPPVALSVTHVLAVSFAVVQLQPVGAVTVTAFDPPPAANDREVVETL